MSSPTMTYPSCTVRPIDLSREEDVEALESACAEEQRLDTLARYPSANSRFLATKHVLERGERLMWVAERPASTSEGGDSHYAQEIIGYIGRSVFADDIDRDGRFTALQTPWFGTDPSKADVKASLLSAALQPGSTSDTVFRSVRVYKKPLNEEELIPWCKREGFSLGTVPVKSGLHFYKKVMPDETGDSAKWETAEKAFGLTWGEALRDGSSFVPLPSVKTDPSFRIREITEDEQDRNLLSDASVFFKLQEMQISHRTPIHPDVIAKMRKDHDMWFARCTSTSGSTKSQSTAFVAEVNHGDRGTIPIGISTARVRHVGTLLGRYAMERAEAGDLQVGVNDHNPQKPMLMERYEAEGFGEPARIQYPGFLHEPYWSTHLILHKD
ncbi:uncharacterized protein MKK02DRAFT_43057 [Dioszegia hungarica]|uniref:Uncharacterized protein n=1 Tax=Dioszegia hungarica TaxID=4972 RepID=A0AA38LYA2_9TREE|nr:uncharacterized protein MKK02DRAFT_43057 [Dioszegia hungarica]KAI9638656.1 hypothetical protein MKK02DRAFT_43057 [Dioszegia hungarica]